jgi:hypothetical protein
MMDLLRSPTLYIPPALMNGATSSRQQQQQQQQRLQKQPFHKPLHRPLEQQQLVQQDSTSSAATAEAAAASVAVQHRGESLLQLNITQAQVRAVVSVYTEPVIAL